MYKELAKIHAEYNIYPKTLMSEEIDKSIISDIGQVKELEYLASFYKSYLNEYSLQSKDNQDRAKLTGAARSVDMPFIGRNVLNTGRAKYMFVFEGSLQNDRRLSITVLSCFWILENTYGCKQIIDKYWRYFNFNNVKDSLYINPKIAENAYVVDSFRVGNEQGKRDTRVNREILLKEIDLLDPELIILVGGTARDILGYKFISENNSKVQLVPFPTKRRNAIQKAEAEEKYNLLRQRVM